MTESDRTRNNMTAASEALPPPGTAGKTVAIDPASRSSGRIGVPSICTIRTLVPSAAGAHGVTHSGESARSAQGFLMKPPRTGTIAAAPSAPPASAATLSGCRDA